MDSMPLEKIYAGWNRVLFTIIIVLNFPHRRRTLVHPSPFEFRNIYVACFATNGSGSVCVVLALALLCSGHLQTSKWRLLYQRPHTNDVHWGLSSSPLDSPFTHSPWREYVPRPHIAIFPPRLHCPQQQPMFANLTCQHCSPVRTRRAKLRPYADPKPNLPRRGLLLTG